MTVVDDTHGRWLPAAARLYSHRAFLWSLCALGVVLRIVKYLMPRSMWFDEAALTRNIVERSPSGLLDRLDYNQAAPPGFLVLQKFISLALGTGEYAFRLFPLLCAVAAIFVFMVLLRQHARPSARPIALWFFVTSSALIYYGSETKQYGVDVLVALSLMALITAYALPAMTLGRAAVLGLAGVVAVWISHPSVFVLAGSGGWVLLVAARERRWACVTKLGAAVVAWLASFGVLYYVSIGRLGSDSYFLEYFRNAFMPLPPTSLSDLLWLPNTFFETLNAMGGFPNSTTALAGIMIVLGAVMVWNSRPTSVALLVAPVVVTLLASGLHRYPVAHRLILFLVPTAYLLLAEGITGQFEAAQRNGRLLITTIAVVLLLLYLPGTLTLFRQGTISRLQNADIVSMMNILAKQWQPGDQVLVNYYGVNSFSYYAPRYGLSKADYIEGVWSSHILEDLATDLEKLRGRPRAWVLFSHNYWTNGNQTLKFERYYLNRMGKRLRTFDGDGVALDLYDLSQAPARPATTVP